MFANLTDQELVSLYAIIKRGRDMTWKWFGPSDSYYEIVKDASDILTDIHNENQSRLDAAHCARRIGHFGVCL